MSVELTVLIPTYNRKEQLKRTLLELEKQFKNNFYVLILDNASPFSIDDEIIKTLSVNFQKFIRVEKRKYNVGLGNNIAGLFLNCDTKWGWLLGDDDIICENAVCNVMRQISNNPDYAGFWFALDERYSDEIELDSLDKFIEVKTERDMFNDSGYLSNKIYNFEYFDKYSEVVFAYSYTMISFTLAIFEMLRNGLKYKIIFNDKIVEHPGFQNGKPTWDFLRVASGMRTVGDYLVSDDWKIQKKYIACSMFEWKTVVSFYLQCEKIPGSYKTFLKNIYYNCYKYTLPFVERVFCYSIIYFISTNIGFHIASKILDLRRGC